MLQDTVSYSVSYIAHDIILRYLLTRDNYVQICCLQCETVTFPFQAFINSCMIKAFEQSKSLLCSNVEYLYMFIKGAVGML